MKERGRGFTTKARRGKGATKDWNHRWGFTAEGAETAEADETEIALEERGEPPRGPGERRVYPQIKTITQM